MIPGSCCRTWPRCGTPKQDPRWKVEQLPNAAVRWTTPSGRQYVTETHAVPDLGFSAERVGVD
jgi:hypothetical protein